MQTREKLEGIQCPPNISQVGRLALFFLCFRNKQIFFCSLFQEILSKFTYIQMFGANTPSHLMTLMRIQTALEGGQAITVKLFNRVINWEEYRQSKYKDWLATWLK